ncbi:Spy/CpxP family protein refolding chaperone [Ramlibacter tataouinensis]|nr:Spy/CpxP family protein refolding chaperone [Ramlibacter tataouinensis]
MTSLRSHLVCAALLASLAAGATAQTAPAAPSGAAAAQEQPRHGGRFDPAKRLERFEQRMTELKQKLQISGSQESAWTSFTNALRPQGKPQRPDREALARMATPDRIDHLRALRNERMAEMDRRGEATKAFYASLTTEQKKVFDEATLRRGHHGHHGGGHRG